MKTLQQIDAEISQLEQKLAVLHEQRREWVNHLDLNKQKKRTIKTDDFCYVVNGYDVTVGHGPSCKTDKRSLKGVESATNEWARERIVAELLAEGWVYAS